MPKQWVTSDTHFGHHNIIEYCSRPFEDVDEMDEELIRNWNLCVGKNDIVYHVGDFGLSKRERLIEIRLRLNGRIVLIKGNHDRGRIAMEDIGIYEFHPNDLLIWEGDTSIYFSHVPNFERKGTIHLYGHVHNRTPENEPKWAHNVCVEVRAYRPVLLESFYA
jgi:calcineurin-like phosphoesterase family protein